MFWKTIKQIFSNKGSSRSNIRLVEKDEALQDDKKIAEELDAFFKNAVSSSGINWNSSIINQSIRNIDNLVGRVIEMYKYYPSIILINNKAHNQNKFSFKLVVVMPQFVIHVAPICSSCPIL